MLVEVIYSRRDLHRAIIAFHASGAFHIWVERWSFEEFTNTGSWILDSSGKTLTDKIDTARALAYEKLTETSDGAPDADLC
jgi:hypothetical protein